LFRFNLKSPEASGEARARPGVLALHIGYGLVAAFGLYASLNLAARLFGADPDVVHSLLMWKGITQHGLGWVSDWRFTPDNWLLSIVPLHAIAYSLLGDSPNIPLFLGWGVFIAAALASAGIAARLGARKALAPIVVVLLNLGPMAHSAGFVSYATSHNTTNLFGLIAVLCALGWIGRRRWLLLLAAAVLMTCGSISDPWMAASYDLPLGLAAAGLALHPAFKARRVELLALLAAVAISLVLYASQLFGLLDFIPKLGFEVGSFNLARQNAVVVEHDVGALLDAIPTAILRAGLAYGVSVLAFLSLAVSLAWTGRRVWLGPDPDKPFAFAVAALSAGGTAAALTIMNAPATEISSRFLINIPYLLAPVIGVLAESCWSRMGRVQKAAAVALPAALTITGMIGTGAHLRPDGVVIRDLGVDGETAFLKANGLSYGYGPYWGSNANVMALATRDAIRVRPVTFSRSSGVMQTGARPQTSRRWYWPSDEPPGLQHWFVMVLPGEEECPDLGLCLAGLRRQFGEPARTLDYGGGKVLVWDHRLLGDPAARLPLAVGQQLSFDEASAFAGTEGWSSPEAWGVWTDGKTAVLRLQLSAPAKGDVTLEFQGHAYLTREGRQSAQVSLNGRPLGVLRFDAKSNEGLRALRVPAGLIPADGRIDLAFEIEQPTAPSKISRSPDPRQLGFALETLRLR
jgi:hypothetical protein